LSPVAIKIPSARLHDTSLIRFAATLGRPLILSTGMSTMDDVRFAVQPAPFQSYILMQCTSSYPARSDESGLRVIQTYRDTFGVPVGFSSHKIGIETCLLAVACGANIIERHITWDRDAAGSDHRMSSTKDDMTRLVSEVRRVEQILGDGVKRVWISEAAERERLRGAA
jgi:N-acetylneuraminate synthase